MISESALMKEVSPSLRASTVLRARRGLLARLAPTLLVLAAILGVGPGLAAAEPLPAPRISLLTMGPGETLVTMFGHDALLVEREPIRPLVYNFGMYTPESITVPRILSGHLRYFLSVEPYERTRAVYERQGRSLSIQRLSLSPEAALALASALSENSRPENAAYRYDYALDNCTTRVRDALDRALDGHLRRALAGSTDRTYRDHALRLTADHPLHAFLLDIGLGPRADRPLSRWDDAYLPDRLAAALREVRLPDGRPLVLEEQVLYRGAREVRQDVPRRILHFLSLGALLGGLLAWVGGVRTRAARALFASLTLLAGAFNGIVGFFLLGLLATEVHPATHGNVNVLLAPPWSLALVVAAISLLLGRERGGRWLVRAAVVCLAGALAGVVAMVVVGQDGFRLAALELPLCAGLALGARRCTRAP
jgi:hypothetical protein